MGSQSPPEQASTNQDGKDINETEKGRRCEENSMPEIIRYVDFLKFSGAKESISSRYGIYSWSLVIPVEDRLVMVEATGNSLDVIENIWAPIVDSMEFEASKFGLDQGEYKQEQADRRFRNKLHKWTNLAPGKSKSLKLNMCISFASLFFYDSDFDYYESAINFPKMKYTKGTYKQSRATTVFRHNLPALQLTVNPNKKAPADKRKSWDHIY